MKNIIRLSFALALVLSGWHIFGVGKWSPGVSAAGPKRESAVVEFSETVRLQGVLLKGQYLIVHDEERMARGEPCTYVYRGTQADETKLVASFHCIHVDREKTDAFKVTFIRRVSPYETPEIKEIQFAGSKDGHQVP